MKKISNIKNYQTPDLSIICPEKTFETHKNLFEEIIFYSLKETYINAYFCDNTTEMFEELSLKTPFLVILPFRKTQKQYKKHLHSIKNLLKKIKKDSITSIECYDINFIGYYLIYNTNLPFVGFKRSITVSRFISSLEDTLNNLKWKK